MRPPKITPMVKQYWSIKEKYADSILFYRMGDFYEMFFEDAKVASGILEITLTTRNKKDESPIPMCGIPVRAVDGYIGRLINRGYKVAICEQTEDAATAKGLVKREVVRVITPGMVIDTELLDEKSNNFVLALYHNEDRAALSYLDISTGAFQVSESEDLNAVIDESLRVSPSEIILPETSKKAPFFAPVIQAFSEKSVTFLADSAFDHKAGRERLVEQFKTRSLEGFGCENLKAGLSAAGALLFYVQETQKQKIEHLTGIKNHTLSNYLLIDEVSCRNLELIRNLQTSTRSGTLIGIIDRTVTAMGGRLLKRWIRYPLLDTQKIEARLEAVDEAKNNIQVRRNIRKSLKSVSDLERLGSKISMGHANARDLVALKISIHMLPDICSALSRLNAALFKPDDDLDGLDTLYELADLIEQAIREDAPPVVHEGGMIKPGYNGELDELIAVSRDGKSRLAKLEADEKKKTGISSLKVRYNKVFGYYIEVSKTASTSVPPHYIRKQTLTNAERYITDELKSFESKVLGAQEQRTALEYRIFNEIRARIVQNSRIVLGVAEFIARLDCLFNLAEIADQNDYCRPEINTAGSILIQEGRHPAVEKMIVGERYVPNTIRLDDNENQILIITGPNMAGKSTILRQVAIMVILAQMGSFVPADHASLCVTDRIFSRVGALDNLSQGQSTFMVEMEETANIMNNATPTSLVIMDEIGRGTSTFDGLSIAWAVAEFLHDLKGKGVKTLFATHYHQLTDLALTKPRIRNFNIAVKEIKDQIIFLRKLVEGGTNRSYGIQVARLAGLPEKLIRRSKEVLASIEKEEHTLSHSLVSEENTPYSKKGHRQLGLFQKNENIVIEELQKLDIDSLTPLEALNCLNELKKKAETVLTDV